MRKLTTTHLLAAACLLVFGASPALAQNARTVVLDTDAAASVSLVRVMTTGTEQNVRSALQQLNTAPVTYTRGNTQTTVVPGSVVSCEANLSVGSVQADTIGATPREIRVFITGTVMQLANGICS